MAIRFKCIDPSPATKIRKLTDPEKVKERMERWNERINEIGEGEKMIRQQQNEREWER